MEPEIPVDVQLLDLQRRLFDEAYFAATLPVFYGTSSWEKFINTFESMTINKYTERQMMHLLMGILKGSAYAYAVSLPPNFRQNYRILKEKLTEKFRMYVTPQANFKLLLNRKQEENEDLVTYANNISNLCNLSLTTGSGATLEQFKVLNFVHGIRDYKVKTEVALLGADISLKTALIAAQEASGYVKFFKCQKIIKNPDEYQLPHKVHCYLSYCLGKVIPQTNDKNIFYPEESNRIDGTMKSNSKMGVMRFNLQGTIGGIYSSILIDTRLQVSIVHPRLLQKLPPPMYTKKAITPRKVDLKIFSGGIMEISGFVKMKLNIFDKYTEQRFLIADIDDNIVFGNNILSALNITVIHEKQINR